MTCFSISWPEAFAIVGVAVAIAATFIAIVWAAR